MSESLMHLYRRAWEAERIRSFALREMAEQKIDHEGMFHLLLSGYDRLCYYTVFELEKALSTHKGPVYATHNQRGYCSAKHDAFALGWVQEVTGETLSRSDIPGKGDWLFRFSYDGEFLDSEAYNAWQVSVDQFAWGDWDDVQELAQEG